MLGELKEKTVIIPGDCFSILDKHPELKGNVDALYVQNLEHFFNPHMHQQFISLWKNFLLRAAGRFYRQTPSRSAAGSVFIPELGCVKNLESLKQRVVINWFSPGIYTRIIERRPELKHLDSYWLSSFGKRIDLWGDQCNWAAVIFEKVPKNSVH